jgi:hypothetical protein
MLIDWASGASQFCYVDLNQSSARFVPLPGRSPNVYARAVTLYSCGLQRFVCLKCDRS